MPRKENLKIGFVTHLLQFVSSVGVIVNLACWYFCKFSSSIGTLRFVLVIKVTFIQDGFAPFYLFNVAHTSCQRPGWACYSYGKSRKFYISLFTEISYCL
jgi:hypothetical protein